MQRNLECWICSVGNLTMDAGKNDQDNRKLFEEINAEESPFFFWIYRSLSTRHGARVTNSFSQASQHFLHEPSRQANP
jgi:hypothetical protein